MEPLDLARWTRFAAKGGIGTCTAIQDCIAQNADDLMFLKDDEIVVLMQFPDENGVYLGHCEDVVGRFSGAHVRFHAKLRKPVMTKRSSSASSSPVTASTTMRSRASSLSSGANLAHTSSPLIPPYSPRPLSEMRSRSNSPISTVGGTHGASDAARATETAAVITIPPLTPEKELETEEEGDKEITPVRSKLSNDPQSHLSKTLIPSSPSPPPLLPSPAQTQNAIDSFDVRRPHPVTFPQPEYELSYLTSDQSSRFSTGSDGEMGIGLSLLQGFLTNGSGDGATPEGDARPGELEGKGNTDGNSGEMEDEDTEKLALVQDELDAEPAPVQNQNQRQSREDDWEGASDIYDDYRYSNQSMASSKIGRLSMGSVGAGGSEAGMMVPPPPLPATNPHSERKSVESSYSLYSRKSFSPSSTTFASAALSLPRQVSIPTPLNLSRPKRTMDPIVSSSTVSEVSAKSMGVDSPLLHGSFASARSSSEPSATSSFGRSSGFAESTLLCGAASVVRERTEDERSGVGSLELGEMQEEKEGREIVVEDEDEGNVTLLAHASPEVISEGLLSSPLELESKGAAMNGLDVPHLTEGPNDSTDSNTKITFPETEKNFPAPPAARPRQQRQSVSQAQSEFTRSSIFMPHPNAPKAPPPYSSSFSSVGMGPMYSRSLGQTEVPPPVIHANSSVHAARTAVEAVKLGGLAVPGGGSAAGGVTIYGTCQLELSNSLTPVPILFSLEPPPPSSPGAFSAAGTGTGSPMYVPYPRRSESTSEASSRTLENIVSGSLSSSNTATEVIATSSSLGTVRSNLQVSKKPRPRSRSFSDLDSKLGEVLASSTSGDEKVNYKTSSNSRRPPNSRSSSTGPSSLPRPNKPSPLRSSHSPSPLSSPHNVLSPPRALNKSPGSSPLLQVSIPASLTAPSSPVSAGSIHPHTLRKSVNEASSPQSQHPRSPLLTESSRPSGEGSNAASPTLRSRASVDTMGSTDSRKGASPTPGQGVTRQTSLRSKLSLPNLRGKYPSGARSEDSTSIAPSEGTSAEMETVQVEHMDFELIKPGIPQFSARSSEDSLTRESSLEVIPEILRAGSPAVSVSSGKRSPLPAEGSPNPSKIVKAPEPGVQMEAHRQRELKWITLMATVPPSQARKNKKIRKLLYEGVPSSVRYLVWAHLSDSKARQVQGVYAQLCKREQINEWHNIEKDIQRCFGKNPKFESMLGSISNLLQAYISMVPDVKYHKGLTLIAGHLLLLAPEEEAFWIFVSMMDHHLRPYFAISTIQIEVDSSLFSRALEQNDSPLAKYIFTDKGINPVVVCRPWFSSFFAGVIPIDFLHRVWDIALLEGFPFLLRVGVAVALSCRRQVFHSNSEQALLKILSTPPTTSLPMTVDAFITQVQGIKLKDDDVRKQRTKMEAQVKRQIQTKTTIVAAGPSTISLPRS